MEPYHYKKKMKMIMRSTIFIYDNMD